ncbi:MAG: polyphosphate kinase 2 family protein [Candidatus Poribacteria bacterium]|nr:polyphosphate kinase 2 family protein [Candidatus Poribacteria bacterium]
MSVKRYRVDPKKFRLEKAAARYAGGKLKESGSAELLAQKIKRMAALQERLFAENRRSVLLTLQARNGAGKDSLIKHVFSGMNSAWCHVVSYKAPSSRELDYGYLWRHFRDIPARGQIVIFNRSYYEEVSTTRVHTKWLGAQPLPSNKIDKKFWKKRFDQINAFEKYLVQNGSSVVKIFLNVSKKEQKARFLNRIYNPKKQWKFAPEDLEERRKWDEYTPVFQEMLTKTSKKYAPWYAVPGDQKWYARLAAADILIHALKKIDPQFPKMNVEKMKQLEKAKAELESEK